MRLKYPTREMPERIAGHVQVVCAVFCEKMETDLLQAY
jgi:hypothetical protein